MVNVLSVGIRNGGSRDMDKSGLKQMIKMALHISKVKDKTSVWLKVNDVAIILKMNVF